MAVPAYIQKPFADPAGTCEVANLPAPLPYHLTPRDVFRAIEDLYDLLNDINATAVGKGYDRLDEILDPAGFSGFISRSIVERLERFARGLVKNGFHNGYPDLLPRGVYAGDAVQHGDRGGLEVKASRNEASWQSHGPRGGWFCVVQFRYDDDAKKALRDRAPTTVATAMVAELSSRDWSWQPAARGRIRSGTASIRPSGRLKLRESAVWIDPTYRSRQAELLVDLRRQRFSEHAQELVLNLLSSTGAAMRADEVAEQLAEPSGLPPKFLLNRTIAALRALATEGSIRRITPGVYAARASGSP